MKYEENRIIEATEKELYELYLSSEMYIFMPFDEYLIKMRVCGVTITNEE